MCIRDRCPRYQNFSPNVNPNITQGAWTLERFQQHFPKEFIQQIKFWTFAGDYGDPGTCPDIIPIIHYINEHGKSDIQINTNGGNKRRALYFQADYIFKE